MRLRDFDGARTTFKNAIALNPKFLPAHQQLIALEAKTGGIEKALDMAKKVTHDRVGRLLKRELRGLGFDLETSRRLFTLLLSLRVDTTKLPGVHGHRTIR